MYTGAIVISSVTAQLKKKQQTSAFIYHAISIYVATTNMPLKCHIYVTYANYL